MIDSTQLILLFMCTLNLMFHKIIWSILHMHFIAALFSFVAYVRGTFDP